MLVYVVTVVAISGFLGLRLKKPSDKVGKAFYREIGELFLFVSLVGLAFSGAQLAIALIPISPSATLLSLERTILRLRSLTDWLTMPAWVQALSFIGLLLFASLSVRMARLKAIGHLSSANKYLAKAHLILTLASAITFFGVGVGEGAARKQAMLIAEVEKTTRGYDEAAKAVEKVAIRAAVSQITKSDVNSAIDNLVAAANMARDTAKKIEATDKRLPSLKDYVANRSDFVDEPASYQLSADLLDIQKGVRSVLLDRGTNGHAPTSASVAINSEINEDIKTFSAVASDEFKTAIAESVDAAYDSSTEAVIHAIAAHASTHNLPAQVLQVLLKKVVSDGFKEYLKDGIADTVTRIYERHERASEAIEALRQKVRNWVSAHDEGGLAQTEHFAGVTRDTLVSVQLETSDVERVAHSFADARSRQLTSAADSLVSGVVLSDSIDIENSWTNIKKGVPPARPNGFDRLGVLQQQYAIAVKLHESAQSNTDDSGATKANTAIEYETLCCATQKLSEAYAVEADRILALEKRSKWGKLRKLADQSVTKNTMNYAPSNWSDAKQTISKWRSYRAKLAVAASKAGRSAKKLPVEQWDEWFAAYLTENSDMAALWGFIVISTTDDDSVWEPYYLERIAFVAPKTQSLDLNKVLGDLKLPSQAIDSNLAPQIPKKQVTEAEIRRHGPYPKDGYRYFMAQMHVQSDADAEKYFSGKEVTTKIDIFCPRTQ